MVLAMSALQPWSASAHVWRQARCTRLLREQGGFYRGGEEGGWVFFLGGCQGLVFEDFSAPREAQPTPLVTKAPEQGRLPSNQGFLVNPQTEDPITVISRLWCPSLQGWGGEKKLPTAIGFRQSHLHGSFDQARDLECDLLEIFANGRHTGHIHE